MITSSNTDRDRQLFDRLRNGDEKALKELVDIYYAPLCLYSAQFTEDEQESEDIVQDLFVRIWEKRLTEQITNLKMYLFVSVRNMSIAFVRKHHINEQIDDLEPETLSEWDDDFSEEALAEKRRQLEESLKKLSPKEYEVLIRIVVDQKKYREAAEEIGVSVNTVKILLRRAMKKLRSENLLLFIFFY